MTNIFSALRIDRKQLEFTGLQFFFWATFASRTFNVVYLRDQGLANTTIGAILAINSFVGIFCQPLWGLVSDRVQSVRKVFMFCLGVSGLFYLMLLFTKSVIMIGFTLTVVVFFSNPLNPLLDSWTVDGIAKRPNVSYGSIRLWGSIGYAVMTFICGRLMDSTSVMIIFPVYAVMGGFTIFLCTKIQDEPSVHRVSFKNMKIGRLFKNYYYVVFLLFALLLNVFNNAAMTFFPNLVEQLGGNKEQLGAIYSLKAIMEIPFFLYGRRLMHRFGYIKLIIIGSSLYILQQFLFTQAFSLGFAVFAQLLQGPAYSLFLLGMLHYVYSLAPEELRSTAQTVVSAFSMGLGAMIGSYGGGVMIDRFGLSSVYSLGAVSNTIVLALFMVSFPIGKHIHKNNGLHKPVVNVNLKG